MNPALDSAYHVNATDVDSRRGAIWFPFWALTSEGLQELCEYCQVDAASRRAKKQFVHNISNARSGCKKLQQCTVLDKSSTERRLRDMITIGAEYCRFICSVSKFTWFLHA